LPQNVAQHRQRVPCHGVATQEDHHGRIHHLVAADRAAVVLELLTGTFYLLMLAIGLAAGALSAHLGWG
jgi:hypothetical protein